MFRLNWAFLCTLFVSDIALFQLTVEEDKPLSWSALKVESAQNIQKALVLTKEQEQAIVSQHNRRREIVKPSATNMMKMSWDSELANLATTYSRNCIYEHNENRAHSRFTSVGENLFISTHHDVDTDLLKGAVAAWDDEKADYDYATRTCKPNKPCGHYTQVVWDNSFKVGCGITICKDVYVDGDLWSIANLFVCNYGPAGNVASKHPFVAGASCSDCDRSDNCESSLCTNKIRDAPFTSIIAEGATWGEWSPWSTCPKYCRTERKRTCNTFVDGDCEGFSFDTTSCTNEFCSESYGFEPWGAWSECSKSCGAGTTTKTRNCIKNTPCSGTNKIISSCNGGSCKKKPEGSWTTWGKWGPCSVTCGGGIKKKTRTCNQPAMCSGENEKEKTCKQDMCLTDHKKEESSEKEEGDNTETDNQTESPGGGAYSLTFAMATIVTLGVIASILIVD